MEITAADRQPRNGADVEIMALSVAGTVVAEFTVADVEGRFGVTTGQNPVLVFQKAAVADLQSAFLQADAGAVAIGYSRSEKIEAFDLYRPATNDPDALVFRRRAGGDQARPPTDCESRVSDSRTSPRPLAGEGSGGEMGNSRSLLRAQRAIPACKPECALQGRETVMAFIIRGV
jgi:hypothetical protein